MEKPTFVHHKKFRKAVEELFRVWKAPNAQVKEILSLVPIAVDVNWAIQGQPGSGKSAFIKTLSKIFYEGAVVNVKLDDSQMPDDVFYYLDLPKLLKEGKEVVYARPFLKTFVKWANEMMTRANQTTKNACLGVLAEREIVYKDTKLEASPGIFLDDYNRYLIGSLEEADWAFLDRHDVNVNIPMTGFKQDVELMMLKYGEGRHAKDISTLVKPLLNEKETRGICEDVKQVEVPIEVAIWATMLMQAFKVCKHERSVKAPAFRFECKDCEFNGEPCSQIKVPLSTRAVDSVISLAKARAWKHKRESVEMQDAAFVLPYVINHRLQLKPEVAMNYLNEEEYAREIINSLLDRKQRIWKEAAQNYVSVAEEKDLTLASKAMESLREVGKKDLVVNALAEWASQIFEARCEETFGKMETLVETFESQPHTLEQVEAALSIAKNFPEKHKPLIERLEKLRDRLEFKGTVNRETYYEKVLPFIAKADPKVGEEMIKPHKRISIDGERVKIEEEIRDEEHDLDIVFKDSRIAEKFRELQVM